MQEDLATSQQQRHAMTRYSTGSETSNMATAVGNALPITLLLKLDAVASTLGILRMHIECMGAA